MKTRQRQGSALLVVLGIVFVITIGTTALSYHATQQMHAAKITREQLKARLIAESGLNKAYHTVKENFSLVDDYEEEATFGDGSYTVESLPFAEAEGGVAANRAQFVSHGVCGIGRAVVSMDVENRSITTAGNTSSGLDFTLPYDLQVGGKLDLQGNFWAEVTTIHANGNVTIKGSAEIDAKTVSSAGKVTWKKPGGSGSVTLLPNQSPVPVSTEALQAQIQQLIDYAKENGAVYANGADIPASPPGGVAYCTGSNVRWSGSGGTGCFIFAGDVAIQGGGHWSVTSVNSYPSLIVLGVGEVHINAGTTIHGAILIPNGSMKLNGNAEIHGPILVGQEMKGVGNADLYAGDGQGFNLPPAAETTIDNVVVTAWH